MSRHNREIDDIIIKSNIIRFIISGSMSSLDHMKKMIGRLPKQLFVRRNEKREAKKRGM